MNTTKNTKTIKVKFHQDTWVLKETEHTGFAGGYHAVKASLLEPKWFEIMSITSNGNYSDILVHKNLETNVCDSDIDLTRLINVPNDLFRIIEE